MWEPVCAGTRTRRILAVLLALPLLLLGPAFALANPDGGKDDNEQRDTQSRNEQGDLAYVPVRFRDGSLFNVHHIILIQTRFVHVTDSFNKNVGIDFDSYDRIDVSDLPLINSFFEAPLSRDDFTEENRVGSVYRGAEGTLVAVLDDDVKVANSEVSVVNGKGRYTFNMMPELARVTPEELGEIGDLKSLQALLRGEAPPETTIVLAGLTETSVPQVESKIPVLGDIPGLRGSFLGGAYQIGDVELTILLKPSIITGDEVE